jgi:hypothetical protein
MNYSFLKKWALGFLVFISIVGILRFKPWRFFKAVEETPVQVLKVGFLPVT